jgi:hypothetical protein
MHEKPLGFGRTKIKHFFFVFLKRGNQFNFFLIFDFFKKNFWRKPDIFNTGFVSYNISLQLDIMQNSWKNMQMTHKYF